MLKISHGFDAGAIETIAADRADDIHVNIRADSHAEFRQWFYFRLQGARGQACSIRFANAGQCTYVDGWRGYRAVASYDRRQWFRVPTSFDGSTLTIAHTPDRDSAWYAYFEPYSWERHLDLLGRAEDSSLARVRDLGSTVDGRDVNLVTVGAEGAGKRPLWVIARQHPGETMAEWFVEGLLDRLLDRYDPVARSLLAQAVVHIVPNMNPDGSRRGHLSRRRRGRRPTGSRVHLPRPLPRPADARLRPHQPGSLVGIGVPGVRGPARPCEQSPLRPPPSHCKRTAPARAPQPAGHLSHSRQVG